MATTAPNLARRYRCVHYIRRTVLAPPSRRNMGLTGVRRRYKGRWASEMRVPRSTSMSGRLWVGTFQHIEQAALAHDATLFCVYGASPPAPRYFNYPDAPRPDIAEDVRVNLTVDDIKTIASNHALRFYDYARSHPPEPAGSGGGPAAIVVDEAVQLAMVPGLVVNTADVPAVTDVVTAGAAANATGGNGSGEYISMGELLAAADLMFSLHLNDRIAFMEFENMVHGRW